MSIGSVDGIAHGAPDYPHLYPVAFSSSLFVLNQMDSSFLHYLIFAWPSAPLAVIFSLYFGVRSHAVLVNAGQLYRSSILAV